MFSDHKPGLLLYGSILFSVLQMLLSAEPMRAYVYDFTIVRHPWQMSENHKPRVHPSHVREIGLSVRYVAKHKIEL